MRRLVLPAALLLVLSAATPAFAGAGLPKITSLQVGSHKVAVHGDSPSLHTGTNVLTVEIAELSPDHAVNVYLKGPSGQSVAVPLRTLTVLTGPEGGHGDGGHGESAAASDSGHGTTATGHGTAATGHDAAATGHDAAATGHDAAATGHDAAATSHEAAASGDFNARGKASLSTPGAWTLVVEIAGHDNKVSAEAAVDVKQGGPNRVYLGFTGLLMGGTIVYGAIQRRRGDNGR